MSANEAHTAASLVLGMNPVWPATLILIATYALLLTEKIHRTIVALLGSSIMITLGIVSQKEAFAGIDFNTISLLTGMMIIVAITRKTGVFEFVAIWSAKKVKANPTGILLVLSFVTAIFSAFLDNLTTVLLIVPVALLITEKLDVSPYPFLVSQIIASNIGGTATLIGDPPNILIGSASGLTFTDFLVNLGPVAGIILLMSVVIFYFLWRKQLKTMPELQQKIMMFKESDTITDKTLLAQCLSVLLLVIAGFIIGEHYNIRPGTTAIMGASVLLLITSMGSSEKVQSRRLHDVFSEVEWSALFFFMGLFIIVHGVEKTGLLELLANKLLSATGGSLSVASYATLWISAIVSAVIDNIPFVATMIPMIDSMSAGLGGPDAIVPVWWSLALGACLGGNGSLLGAAANVMVAGLGDRAGHPIHFVQFLKIGLPVMLLTIIVANVYLSFRFF